MIFSLRKRVAQIQMLAQAENNKDTKWESIFKCKYKAVTISLNARNPAG